MLVSQPAKKYGIAVDLPEKVDPKDGAVVLQYDLRLQNGLECGGAYLKFLQPQVRVWKGWCLDCANERAVQVAGILAVDVNGVNG